jgi:hypothetical protein
LALGRDHRRRRKFSEAHSIALTPSASSLRRLCSRGLIGIEPPPPREIPAATAIPGTAGLGAVPSYRVNAKAR